MYRTALQKTTSVDDLILVLGDWVDREQLYTSFRELSSGGFGRIPSEAADTIGFVRPARSEFYPSLTCLFTMSQVSALGFCALYLLYKCCSAYLC